MKQSLHLQKLGLTFMPPARLAARIDSFTFNCREFNGDVSLPRARVKEGLEKEQLSVDCPNCHAQYPFNHNQAKRRSLSVMFHEAKRKDPAENSPQNPSPEPNEVISTQHKMKSVTSPGIDYDNSILESG